MTPPHSPHHAASTGTTYFLATSAEGMNQYEAQELCASYGLELAQFHTDYDRLAVNAFNYIVPQDLSWGQYSAWIAGRFDGGMWYETSDWPQQKYDGSHCDSWFEGCCEENDDPRCAALARPRMHCDHSLLPHSCQHVRLHVLFWERRHRG